MIPWNMESPVPQTAPQNAHNIDTMDGNPLASYNNKVCAAWEAIKDTADSNVFERNLFHGISNNTVYLNSHEHLSADKQAYLPVFERLVNVKKYQQKGIAQIQLIHSSVRVDHYSILPAHHHTCGTQVLGMHYHLMATSWNPTTSNLMAGWCKESSSDPVYLSLFSSPHHLLERFNCFATCHNLPGQKPKDTDFGPNDQLHKDFTAVLNKLLAKHLHKVNTKKMRARVHIHPKKEHCDVLLRSIPFPNDIRLAVHQTSDSKVTAKMLAAGPAAIMNDKEQMQVWHQDILAHCYTVLCVKDNKEHSP
ncbi:hypothetical protein DFH28DRAFT_1086683 [Melampsora americana]|nr:hypothetical protein DFH28DRAFT_1086683 [Melampsora americana]